LKRDEHLEGVLRRHEGWMREGKVPYPARVIPVGESLEAEQWVLPTERAVEVLRSARSFVLADCVCRTHYRRCGNPVETCFVLDGAAEAYLEEGKGREVSLDEAERVLREADRHGLVHLAVNSPDRHPWGLCSCCTCCCYHLQILKGFDRPEWIVRSEYRARTDLDRCVGCGTCADRCPFEARAIEDGELRFEEDRCYGCGLCVSTCPEEAITLELGSGAAASRGGP